MLDRQGKRVGTVYLGQMPESGQGTITDQLSDLLKAILTQADSQNLRLAYVSDEILCLSADSLSGPLLISFFEIIRNRSPRIDHQVRKKLMTTTATHHANDHIAETPLFVAFELSERTWKLGFTTGHGQKPRERSVTARDQERVLEEIAKAKQRLGLPETAPVVSCYEAG